MIGCHQSAVASYLDACGSQAVEFGVCPIHHVRLQKGLEPVIVAEFLGLFDVDGHPALLLD